MALQESSAAKTSSDANQHDLTDIYTSETVSALDAEITTVSTAAGAKYVASIVVNRIDVDNRICILESDESTLDLSLVVMAIESRSYSVTDNLINGSKIEIKVGWNG